MSLLDHDTTKDNLGAFIVRQLSTRCSIRRGKYGPYIYYQSATMTKPEFYSIKKFKEDFTRCDVAHLKAWVEKTHKVVLEI